MIVLGIHDGHNCGVSLFKDNKLLFAISEERISRKKNEYGFPYNSIKYCLKKYEIKKKDIDRIAVSTINLPPKYFAVKRNTSFKISDYLQEQEKYWFPKIYKKKNVKYLDIFKKKILSKKEIFYDLKSIKHEDDFINMKKIRLDFISNFFKIEKKKIKFFDHHKCHAYYGYYSSNYQKKNNLAVVTADGGGDGKNGSIWIKRGKKLKEVYNTNLCNIGRIYRYTTLILGMKPTEHEYKVMGLAGYGLKNTKYYDYTNKVFSETLNCKGISFFYKRKPKDLYFYFKEKLKNQRFDAIAFSIQKFTEEILNKWFLNISSKFKVNNFIFSGGVAQNIKATKKILSNKKIKSIFIPPGPGDESLCIGAAYCLLSELKNINLNDKSNIIPPYIGTNYKVSDLKFIFKKQNINIKKSNPKQVAKLLNKGFPVALFSLSKSEFGPRALGNRSIIAKPNDSKILHTINKFIKVRDFWMPFAPSIINERFNKYVKNSNKIDPIFMTHSCDSTEEGKQKLVAATHPFDGTSRPQKVYKKYNEDYFNIIKEFEKISGIGAVLNTSFNLHGEPIVESPKDAFKTFKKSGLKYLYIGNYLITKLYK